MKLLGYRSVAQVISGDLSPVEVKTSGALVLEMPRVENVFIIAGFVIRGPEEVLVLCDSLYDMQTLFQSYQMGLILDLHWYEGVLDDVALDDIPRLRDHIRDLIRETAGHIPDEVRAAITAFARGDSDVTKLLAQEVKMNSIMTREQLENLVGWPLWDHSYQRVQEIPLRVFARSGRWLSA